MKMKPLLPEAGPVLGYLSRLPADQQQQIYAAVQQVLNSPDGSILLELLYYSIVVRTAPRGAEARALDDLNAQAFIVHDLKRIASDEHEYLGPVENPRPQRSR